MPKFSSVDALFTRIRHDRLHLGARTEFPMLFGIVVSWLATLWYAALLAFKLRAQRSGP
jgi:hypothetical protein